MSDMLTQGRGARVKNPTTKLTIDNLVKPVLSSHHENIAAAEARKLPPTGPTSQSAQVSGTSSTTTPAVPPSTPGPSITDVDAGQASSSAHNGIRLGQALYKICDRLKIVHKVRDEIHDPGRGLSPSRAQANPRPR